MYEKSNEIGGRLSTFNYKNKDYETGGSILHPGNIYMDSLRKICGLYKIIIDYSIYEYKLNIYMN